MPLSIGTRLGPYEIQAPLGAGGMGEVYKALDTRLERSLALKVLPAATMGDTASRTRFIREAQAASRLNHPSIVTIHDIGETGARVFIAMELVSGKTLDAWIPPGGLPLDDALKIAVPIALAAAHDAGIVHRDLKPGNVMVTAEGVVKVLDFGLARMAEESGDDCRQTEISTVSASGMIVGTPRYMSPEQARGKRVDKRADIWAFGVLLYEMLAGEPLFRGETVADTLAEVLTVEPSWDCVPYRARRLLRRCLDKDPQRRLRDPGDVWDLLDAGEVPRLPPAPRRPLGWMLAAGLAGIAALAGFWTAWRALRPAERPLLRLSVDLGPDAVKGLNLTAAISPDGRRLVFPARGPDGQPQLAMRLLDEGQPTLLPGSAGGFDPFFSPDSQWVGFFTASQLKKVPVRGGAPVTLCPAPGARGASWGEDGHIVAALNALSGLARVPEAGGAPEPLTTLGPGEGSHRWPQVLTGGDVVFTSTAFNIGSESARIGVFSAKSGNVKHLSLTGYNARYLPTGHLAYVHQGVLWVVGFDLATQQVRGAPRPLLEDLAANPMTGGGQFSFSGPGAGQGTMVYLAGKEPAVTWQVVWLDSSGRTEILNPTPGIYTNPRVSPDGRKLALVNGTDIYIHDLERDTTAHLRSGRVTVPVWAPDGQHISVGDSFGIAWMRSDGAGEPIELLEGRRLLVPWSFSPDGSRLAYYTRSSETGNDLWTLPLDLTDPDRPRPGKPELFLGTPASEADPQFSPDGRWIAYTSDESGHGEVYVRPFPGGNGGKWQVSRGSAGYPIWSKKRRELFYETTDHQIMAVDYTVNGNSFVPGKPRLWTERPILSVGGMPNLDLAPDGKRFVVFAPVAADAGRVHVTMLLNFFDDLLRRMPKGSQ